MQENHTNLIGRRPVLKGAGVALAGLGGLAGTAGAKKGGKTALTDRAVDFLLFSSTDGTDFGYPASPFYGGHDQANGGLFDFSKIMMTPNGGTLHNSFELFAGFLLKTKPKPYVLAHLGDGAYESRGQVMRFEAVDEAPFPFPAIQTLAGKTWRAVATERAQLGLKNGKPDPEKPEWGVTRVDFYDVESGEYGLSLLYLLGADDSGSATPTDGIPQAAHMYAASLIDGGKLNPGGK